MATSRQEYLREYERKFKERFGTGRSTAWNRLHPELARARQSEYGRRRREKFKQEHGKSYMTVYLEKNPEARKRRNELKRERRKDPEYREKRNEEVRASARKIRELVLTVYGPVCTCCGLTEKRFLTMHHINGGGTKHRAEIGNASLYRWLRDNNFPPGFQTMCFNCNCGMAANGGICPHKQVMESS